MNDLVTTNAADLYNSSEVKEKFAGILGNDAKFFMQSVVNSLNNNPTLLKCDGLSV
jgi:recombinational DNA repair protein RecT